jgi:hypothetical protein
MMQSELIRSLQIAQQYDNAVLDLTKLQEDAVMSRRDVLTALDDLRNRLSQQPAQHSPAAYTHPLHRKPSLESNHTYATAHSLGSETLPPGVTMPEEESKGGIGKFLSIRRKKVAAPSSHRASFVPSFDSRSPSRQTNEYQHPAERPTEYELPAEDVIRPTSTTESQFLHPGMANSTVSRHRSSSTASRSEFFDEKIPVLSEGDELEPLSPGTAVEMAGALPPQHFLESNHSRYPSTSSTNASVMSPTSAISAGSPLPSPTAAISPDSTFSFRRRSAPRPVSSSTHSSTYSHRASSISMPAAAISAPATMLGRPSKENNYWGFCKGAWTIREDWRKGLQMATVPAGMYTTKSMWRCKSCAFDGDVYGNKKPYQVDRRVFKALESGVQYRFLFLAKSHVKRKLLKDDNTCFGCIVCANEGKGTSIFGNVETLCNHLVAEHGKTAMSDDMQVRNRCIVGRVADISEDFDFNIPGGLASVGEDGENVGVGTV